MIIKLNISFFGENTDSANSDDFEEMISYFDEEFEITVNLYSNYWLIIWKIIKPKDL